MRDDRPPALQLPAERIGHSASTELLARRAALRAAVDSGMWHTSPSPRETDVAGVRVLWFDPPGRSRGTLLHMHGGAFRIGCPDAVAPFAASIATRTGVTVACPAYRLAPEHPFPAGLSDGASVMRACCEATHQPLVVSGDSAGGALAAGLAMLAHAQATPLAGLVLLSPWLDLGVSDNDYVRNAATDPMFSAVAAREAAGLYLQHADAMDALASPMFGSVAGFPRTLISTGTGEVLAGDARRFAAKLSAAGVPVQLDMVDGMEHVAVTRDLRLSGAAHCFDTMARFIDLVMTIE